MLLSGDKISNCSGHIFASRLHKVSLFFCGALLAPLPVPSFWKRMTFGRVAYLLLLYDSDFHFFGRFSFTLKLRCWRRWTYSPSTLTNQPPILRSAAEAKLVNLFMLVLSALKNSKLRTFHRGWNVRSCNSKLRIQQNVRAAWPPSFSPAMSICPLLSPKTWPSNRRRFACALCSLQMSLIAVWLINAWFEPGLLNTAWVAGGHDQLWANTNHEMLA